jgi:hypothetical protein
MSPTACPDPHPQRGPDGLSHYESLEVIGGESSDAWVRCRACGRWFWLATDVGGKYDYVGGKEIDADLAERAFLCRDLAAIVDLCVSYELPKGPVWQSDRALLALLRKLAPATMDDDLDEALSRAPRESPLASVRRLLAARREADREAPNVPAPALAFVVNIECDSHGIEDAIEMPGAVVLCRAEPPFELIRFDSQGSAVRILLPAEPRFLASNGERALWGIAGEEGEVVFSLGPDGTPELLPATPHRVSVIALDEGFFLFVPQTDEEKRYVDLRRPDLTTAARLRVPGGDGWGSVPVPPRKLPGGWVTSGVLDRSGEEVALSLFDDAFELIARAEGSGTISALSPLPDGSVLGTTTDGTGTLERWVREGTRMTRTWARQARASLVAGECVVVLSDDMLSGLDATGIMCWSIRHGGAHYLASSGDLVVAYGAAAAAMVVDARSGGVVKRLQLMNDPVGPEVFVDVTGAVYLRDDRWLWIIADGAVTRVALPFAASLLTTAGPSALLGDALSGQYVLVGRDGSVRGGFSAEEARFSVVATQGGPYVVEPRRLRVLAFRGPAKVK